ncbi:MAG TPA: SAM-dependent methyltransferase [Gammaproteobacteria bacterium]|nr:SAM-dependent methyltransferase [Gammaproteobacteria bacterium]
MAQGANDPARVSRTSIYVAAGRALGAREPDAGARNPDSLAERLLGDPSVLDLDHPAVRALSLDYDEAMKDIEVIGIVRMMTVRTRFIDEALGRATASGAKQVVILGAGFDSHAYRCRDLLAGAKVFEVDRPATQAFKKQRVNEVLGGPPPNLSYVAVDFGREDLTDIMARHGCDPGQRTFFILEGVTMYLPEDAVRGTLRFVAAHAPGSGIVFDFVYRPLVEMLSRIDVANVPAPARPFVQRFLDLIRDEPWVFGLPVGGERDFLGALGLELRETLAVGGDESSKRYLTRADGTQVGAAALAEAMTRMARMRAESAAHGTAVPQISAETLREQQRVMSYQLADAVVAAP